MSIVRCTFLMVLLGPGMVSRAQDDLVDLEDQAIRDAVERVAPAVVRIETFGGLERVGRTLVGDGPTTGVIVSPDGFIVSSAFNFARKPTSILVTLPDGERSPAQTVARDESRMLVLLKTESNQPLPTVDAVDLDAMSVGQWTIAVGRALDARQPNVSVGILSATDRIWGKAVQTDAKISPNNYGGPLVDIRGRVLGILVPLAPDAQNELAGAQWYDSGIGFAIPMVDIRRQLPRLQAGEDLYPGRLGAAFEGEDIYSAPATVAAVQVKSPADEAGLKVGDTVIEVDGVRIERRAQFKHALGPRYAGEDVRLVVLRGEERVELTATLTDELVPYEHPFLGILPVRSKGGAAGGVEVRFVYAGSGAAEAGIQSGDRIMAWDEQPIADAGELRIAAANASVGETVTLAIQRGGDRLAIEARLGSLPADVPPELPPAATRAKTPPLPPAATGLVEIKIPEDPNACFAWVPKNYDPDAEYGVVVCLPVPGEFDRNQFQNRWEAACRDNRLIAVAPLPVQEDTWQPTEVEFVRKAVDDVLDRYSVDRSRVVAYGREAGGAMAFLVTFRQRDLFRGVAVVNATVPMRLQIPDNDPLHRLAVYMALAKDAKAHELGKAAAAAMQAMKYPVTLREQEGFAELLRWIDTLDRI
jgi:serine protease Do